MADIYVSPTGDDTNGDGSSSNPYQHIYKAIDASADGDTIICKSGTYKDELYRNIGEKNITIKSRTGDYQDVVVIPKTYNNDGTGNRGWLWRVASNDYTLTLFDLTFLLDYNNIDTSNTNFGGDTTGIFASDGNGNLTAVRCFAYAVPSRWSGTGQKCHFTYEDWNGGNTHSVYKCSCRHLNTAIGQVRNTVNAKDDIFEDNDYGISRYNTDGTVNENNNDFYNNGTNIQNTSLDSTDLTSDPQFKDTDVATTKYSSPCIDAGVVISGYVETYYGDAPDIGCYEFPPYKISGQVTLNGVGVSGAIVRVIDQNGSYFEDTTTDSNGYYSINCGDDYYHVVVEYTDGNGNKYNAASLWDIQGIKS